jgi:hypothetical protein
MKPIILILSFLFTCSIDYAQNSVADSQRPADSTQVDASVAVNTAPPSLPNYAQPDCPVDGYLWQPGYWAYSSYYNDFFWVPGAWISPPQPGLYWTPSYWGYEGGLYVYHSGYWGQSVGYYGGINYGYGYQGRGYVGGEWHNGAFRYNTAVVNVNTTVIHNTYINNSVVVNNPNRASFNGVGGVNAKPTQQELLAMKQPHVKPTNEQIAHQQKAVSDKDQFASSNHGKPTKVTMDKVNGTSFNTSGHTPAVTPPNRMNGNQTGSNPNVKSETNGNKQISGTNHQTQQPRQTQQQPRQAQQQTQQQPRQTQQQPRPTQQQPRPTQQQPRPTQRQPRQVQQQPRQVQQQPRQVQQQPRQPVQKPKKTN